MSEVLQDILGVEVLVEGGPVVGTLLERAQRYASLASLLRPSTGPIHDAVRRLAAPCWKHPGGCPFPELVPALPAIDAVVCAHALDESYGYELARVLGDPGEVRRFPMVSPCAATYSVSGSALPGRVLALYRRWGFGLCDRELSPECACHVANELDFAAHCLMLSGVGVPGALGCARAFQHDELQPWVPLFAAAVIGTARHPLLRYVARKLDAFMACETLTFLCDPDASGQRPL